MSDEQVSKINSIYDETRAKFHEVRERYRPEMDALEKAQREKVRSVLSVTGLYGHSARNAITGITLFAGFASTVGWPTSAFFIDAFGWRGACLAWAALHVLIGLPLNRLLVPKAPSPANEPLAEGAAPSPVPWTMIVLAFVFGATWFVSTAMAAHLPRLLEAFGVTTAAAVFAASLVGPAQVAARLIEFTFLRRASPMISARLATGLHPLAAVLLALVGSPAAVPFVLLHGAGNGLLTIARGTLPLALFGPAGYGLRTGVLAAPARILQGGAPLLFGLVLDRGGASLGAAADREPDGAVVRGAAVPATGPAGADGLSTQRALSRRKSDVTGSERDLSHSEYVSRRKVLPSACRHAAPQGIYGTLCFVALRSARPFGPLSLRSRLLVGKHTQKQRW